MTEDLMRRFIVGDVTEAERDTVEAFAAEPAGLDALCALEMEMFLAHVEGTLPREWRERFERGVLSLPARRRRVDEVRALSRALRRQRRLQQLRRLSLAAMLVLAAGSGMLYLSRRPPAPGDTVPAAPQARMETLRLEGGRSRRGASAQANLFSLPGGTNRIALLVRHGATGLAGLRAELRNLDTGDVLPTTVTLQRDGDSTEIRVETPAPAEGDYVLTLSAGEPPDTIASRFFTIAR